MNYKIYQVDPHNCDYAFEWWSWAQDRFNFNDYELKYEGEGEVEVEDVNKTLEDLFTIFNIKRPEDFKGHSLSVSDIIELDGKYYYCDNVGWTDITKYIK